MRQYGVYMYDIGKKILKYNWKTGWDVAWLVECLPVKHKALCSVLSFIQTGISRHIPVIPAWKAGRGSSATW